MTPDNTIYSGRQKSRIHDSAVQGEMEISGIEEKLKKERIKSLIYSLMLFVMVVLLIYAW